VWDTDVVVLPSHVERVSVRVASGDERPVRRLVSTVAGEPVRVGGERDSVAIGRPTTEIVTGARETSGHVRTDLHRQRLGVEEVPTRRPRDHVGARERRSGQTPDEATDETRTEAPEHATSTET